MSDKPRRNRNWEKHNAAKRAEYKSETPWLHQTEPRPNRAAATYDPLRDGPLHHASPAAALMGDPPIGRRAIDTRGGPA